MAAAQSKVTLPKKWGSSMVNWTDVVTLFRRIVDVTNIENNQQVGFLKLPLKDAALQLFHTVDKNTRADLELTKTALKSHFCNPNLIEIHHINLEIMKFNHETDSLEEFLVELQDLAIKAYPTPVDEPVAPLKNTVANDQARVDRENRANENRRKFARTDRERHITPLFRKTKPNFLRL